MVEPEFAELMADTIELAPAAERDRYGRATWHEGDLDEITGHVTYEQETVSTRSAGGMEENRTVRASGRVWLSSVPDYLIPAQQDPTQVFVRLPDGSTPPLVKVSVHRDGAGYHHAKLWFR